VAVLTNSSLMPRDDVKSDLAKADMVVAKLDAADEGLFCAINRPLCTTAWLKSSAR
jgi:wyosine [tRNA(Phe)-imidazoG37] synthetase (radical SAM superfamily)